MIEKRSMRDYTVAVRYVVSVPISRINVAKWSKRYHASWSPVSAASIDEISGSTTENLAHFGISTRISDEFLDLAFLRGQSPTHLPIELIGVRGIVDRSDDVDRTAHAGQSRIDRAAGVLAQITQIKDKQV